jgi:hypothetical protein
MNAPRHRKLPPGARVDSRPRWRSALVVAAFAVLLGGCSVAESTRVDFDAPGLGYGPGCTSTLGSYALPKGFLHIQIGQTDPSTPPDISVPTQTSPPVNVVLHPDPLYMFCLDHLNSWFSDDAVKVIKSQPPGSAATAPKEAFLGAVTFNITDQSAYIIEALVRSAFILASGNAQFAARNAVFTPAQVIGDFEYDPFDQSESANVNSRLQKLGFCLVLEFYTFDPRVGVQRYCDDPLRYVAQPTMFAKAYTKGRETPADPHLPGLMYRPRYPYRLSIYRKSDPHGPDRWRLSQTTTVKLENLSPLLSLGVTRALFAGKNVNFVFQEGALTTACVSKDSEVEGFVQIPLQISKSLVALPSSIFSIQIGQVTAQRQLVQAEQQLYLVQRAYLLNMMGQTTALPTGVPTSASSPAAVDPNALGVPSDLTKQAPAQGYASDLFQNDLKSVCQSST